MPSSWEISGKIPAGRYLGSPAGDDKSDRTEKHLRKLSGGSHWWCVRQFLVNEALIRTSYDLGPMDLIGPHMVFRFQPRLYLRPNGTVTAGASAAGRSSSSWWRRRRAALSWWTWTTAPRPPAGHISGTLARSATRRNKCGTCASLIIHCSRGCAAGGTAGGRQPSGGGDLPLFYSIAGPGKASGAIPTQLNCHINLTMRICQIWRQLLKVEASRNQLLTCNQPRRAFVEVTKMVTNKDAELTEVICGDDHDVLRSLLPQMSAALFNLFTGNLVREANSATYGKRKSDTQLLMRPDRGATTRGENSAGWSERG